MGASSANKTIAHFRLLNFRNWKVRNIGTLKSWNLRTLKICNFQSQETKKPRNLKHLIFKSGNPQHTDSQPCTRPLSRNLREASSKLISNLYQRLKWPLIVPTYTKRGRAINRATEPQSHIATQLQSHIDT